MPRKPGPAHARPLARNCPPRLAKPFSVFSRRGEKPPRQTRASDVQAPPPALQQNRSPMTPVARFAGLQLPVRAAFDCPACGHACSRDSFSTRARGPKFLNQYGRNGIVRLRFALPGWRRWRNDRLELGIGCAIYFPASVGNESCRSGQILMILRTWIIMHEVM